MFRTSAALGQLTNDDYYFKFVRPAPDLPVKKGPLDEEYAKAARGLKFVDKAKTQVFIDNPLCVHSEDAPQCDLKKILAGNPDVNGLSLLLDDSYKEDLRERLSISDFVPPGPDVDLLDYFNFMKESKNAFMQLPASFRKLYDNDVSVLCSKLADPTSELAVLQQLKEYVDIGDYLQNGETPVRQGAQANSSSQSNKDQSENSTTQKTNNNNEKTTA
ncbi:internal scaffolding protein [Sigmofec virus UA08Rod_6143]|uniref:Internal scaffolding protein n=1 Tax=Sigmofec virus UA08Rod_6143 TaxID=2929223 RepID=A0A976R784_9VIRU|nr:internal scaffolding protein [Sigmofec virus UA08Rod_6143]